jgi:putative tryptophan/tyrosine transport system substrate-binding protein
LRKTVTAAATHSSQTTRRRRAILRLGAAAGLIGVAQAGAQGTQVRRLGVLLFDSAQTWDWLRLPLRDALAQLGWVEGGNLRIEWSHADGDAARLPALAKAMVASGVHVILSNGSPATRALQAATQSLPIVTGVGDPVGQGYAQSLARPGGNITGLSYAVVEAARKQLELLRELVPGLARVSLVLRQNRRPFAADISFGAETAAREAGLTTRLALADTEAELLAELQRVPGRGGHAALVFGFAASIEPGVLARAMLRARVPAAYDQRRYVEAGGLVSYQLDWPNQTERFASQLAKVLRGDNPAQIPFEFPTRSELVLNAGTARQLGLTVPTSLRLRADAVIE